MLGQSKFEGLTLFRNVNHEGVDTVLVTAVGGYRVSYGSTLKMSSKVRYTGLTHVKLKDIASVFRNQLGRRIQNFEVFLLLRDC